MIKRKRFKATSYTGFQPSPVKRKKFEYRHFDYELTSGDLNNLGNNGWELVSHTGVAAYGQLNQYYVFKREKI